MFDTMTMTKTLGGACGALLLYMLGGWASETIYHGGGGHGDDQAQGYEIEVADAGGEPAEDVEEIDFAVVMASASAADGEDLWRNCRSCHALEAGNHGVGPSLYGVVNRAVGSEDFGYSGALVAVAETWTPENLQAFLEDPKGWAPGTAMGYNGMRKVEDRANLIAYLATIGG